MNIKHIEKRIYTRIATEKGSFVYNPEMGSLLYTLKRSKNLQEVIDLAYEYIKESLRPEFKNGTIKKMGELRVIEKKVNTIKLELDLFINDGNKITIPIEV